MISIRRLSILSLTMLLLRCLTWADSMPITGDVNGDSKVDVEDVNIVINMILKVTANIPAGDVNHDGKVDVDDVNKLINIILHKDTPGTVTVKGVSFKMTTIEGGTFSMGATAEQGSDYSYDELPVHQVTLNSFLIGETEVTQELWQAVMGGNPSYYTGNPHHPVERVSWNDCNEFIKRLNTLTGRKFRLPSEAEWEYAARGGNKSGGHKYAGGDKITDVAWHDSGMGTHPVGSKNPNELGLYDMSGNVWEWCHDHYGAYDGNAQVNPVCGTTTSEYCVARGGSWYDTAGNCRVSARGCTMPTHTGYSVGLRLAEDIGGISRLTLETEFLKMDVGRERTVAISGGSGRFVATVADPTVAQVTISDPPALNIKALNGGSTVIVVTDTETQLSASVGVIVNDAVLPQSMNVAGTFNGNNLDTALDMVQCFGADNVFWHLVYIDQDGIMLMRGRGSEEFIIDYDDINVTGDLADDIFNNDGKIASSNPGWYLVIVTASLHGRIVYDVQFNKPNVWLMGTVTSDDSSEQWREMRDDCLFEVPETADGYFVSPAFKFAPTGDSGLRAYVKVGYAIEWWKSEFMLFDGKIKYRGAGDDQERITDVTPGQKLYLNFSTETGKIE